MISWVRSKLTPKNPLGTWRGGELNMGVGIRAAKRPS